jgi:hypothetical protein
MKTEPRNIIEAAGKKALANRKKGSIAVSRPF